MYTVISGNLNQVASNLNKLEKEQPEFKVMGLDKNGSNTAVLVHHKKPFEPINRKAEAAKTREAQVVVLKKLKEANELKQAEQIVKDAQAKLEAKKPAPATETAK